MAMRKFFTLAAALCLLGAAGCGLTAPAAPALTPEPLPEPSPSTDPLAWRRGEVPEAGLTLLVPPEWQALEDGGYWSPEAGARVSISALALPPGTPLSAAFLPGDEYDVFEGRSFASGLGLGEYLGIAVYRSDRQANPGYYELHILVSSGDHPAVDFAASAPTLEAVEALRPALERLAAGARWE